MKKSNAKKILGWGFFGWEQLEGMSLKDRFDKFREFYCPNYYEILQGRDEADIKRAMYDKAFIKSDDEPFTKNKIATEAFITFSDIHDAYNTLAENKDYKELNIGYYNIREFEKEKFGEKKEAKRYIADRIAFFGSFFPIVCVLSFILAVFFSSSPFGIFNGVLFFASFPIMVIARIADIWVSPRDHLLIIPDMIKEAKADPSKDPFNEGIKAVAVLLFYCRAGGWRRIRRYKNDKEYQEYCRRIVDERYERTIKELELYMETMGKEKYLESERAFAYFAETDFEVDNKTLRAMRKAFLRTNAFYSALVDHAKEEIKNVEEAKTDAVRSAVKDYDRAVRRAERKLQNSYDEWANGRIGWYSEYDRDEAISKAERRYEISYDVQMERLNNQMEHRLYELEIINRRVDIATLSDYYKTQIKES